MPGSMSSRPIGSCEFDSPAGFVNNFHSIGGERELDFIHMEEGCLAFELFFLVVVLHHETFVFEVIHLVPHLLIQYKINLNSIYSKVSPFLFILPPSVSIPPPFLSFFLSFHCPLFSLNRFQKDFIK